MATTSATYATATTEGRALRVAHLESLGYTHIVVSHGGLRRTAVHSLQNGRALAQSLARSTGQSVEVLTLRTYYRV